MAKPNYSFEKRQRELAKKKKKEDKAREKAERKSGVVPEGEAEPQTDAEPQDGEGTGEQQAQQNTGGTPAP